MARYTHQAERAAQKRRDRAASAACSALRKARQQRVTEAQGELDIAIINDPDYPGDVRRALLRAATSISRAQAIHTLYDEQES